MLKSMPIKFFPKDMLGGQMSHKGDRFIAMFMGARVKFEVEEVFSGGCFALYKGLTKEKTEEECLKYLRDWIKTTIEKCGHLPYNVPVIDLPDEILAKLKIFFDGACLQCDCHPILPEDEVAEEDRELWCQCDVPFRREFEGNREFANWIVSRFPPYDYSNCEQDFFGS